jgi:hypothetical protein
LTLKPAEFEPLIKEKIKEFCGRKFVFDAFEQFINNHPCGYFTVVPTLLGIMPYDAVL